MAERFTPRQGEYLAFLHLYTLLNRRPPAEADFQAYFSVSPAAVHSMLTTLENRELIQRTPGQAQRYPNVVWWVKRQGGIELGYDPTTDTCARALDEGGMLWGRDVGESVADWMEAGIKNSIEAWGSGER